MMFLLFSMASHRYAICSSENVPNRRRSIGVNGSSLYFRMVNAEPCGVTSSPRASSAREPSSSVVSTMGLPTEMCRPACWAIRTM